MLDKLPEFIGNHPGLFALLGAILGALAWTTLQGSGARRLSPAQATVKINREDAVVLDVRSEAEFQSGHVFDSINIPLTQIESSLHRIQKHKDKPVLVICASGQRSTTACRQLGKAGFGDVYSVAGGIGAWESASLPLKRGKN